MQVRNEVVRNYYSFTTMQPGSPQKSGGRGTVLVSPRATNGSAHHSARHGRAPLFGIANSTSGSSSCRGSLLSKTCRNPIILCGHIVTKWIHKAAALESPAQWTSLNSYAAGSVHTWPQSNSYSAPPPRHPTSYRFIAACDARYRESLRPSTMQWSNAGPLGPWPVPPASLGWITGFPATKLAIPPAPENLEILYLLRPHIKSGDEGI